MITVQTIRFGEVQVDPKDVYRFVKPLPGFEQEVEFALLPTGQEDFLYLQSLQTPELTCLLTQPFVFFPEYVFDLDDAAQQDLKIVSEADVQVYSIVKIEKNTEDILINLTAPVVFNINKNLAKQYIINSSPYSIKQPLDKPLIRKEQEQYASS